MSNQPDIHPDMRAFVADMAALPAYESVADEREHWHALCLRVARPCPESIRTEDRTIPGGEVDVPVRIYRPGGAGPKGCVVYLQGGGFVSGTLDTGDFVAWGLAEGTGCVTVSVDYRLAPEHRYPAAFDDSFNVVRYLYDNPEEFGIDRERIAVAGDSAGGNLSAAVCLAARDRGGPPIAAQALIYPGLGLERRAGASSTSPTLADDEIDYYRRAYLGDRFDTRDPYARPLLADDFANLPPCLIHTAEHDLLTPEGEAYAERLRAAGTPVEYRCAAGMVHSFIRVRDAGPAVAAEFDAICGFLARRVGGARAPGEVA